MRVSSSILPTDRNPALQYVDETARLTARYPREDADDSSDTDYETESAIAQEATVTEEVVDRQQLQPPIRPSYHNRFDSTSTVEFSFQDVAGLDSPSSARSHVGAIAWPAPTSAPTVSPSNPCGFAQVRTSIGSGVVLRLKQH